MVSVWPSGRAQRCDTVATSEARPTGGRTLPLELTKHDVELWSRAALGLDYLLVGRARAGSFGTVFRARMVRQQAEVAVKVVSPSRAGGAVAVHDAFVKAAELGLSLGDDALLLPIGVGRGEEVAYQVYPWMAGGSVADMLRSPSPLPMDRIVDVLRSAAAVLDRAHARGAAHRGLRPGNLLFDDSGRLRIGDFGADPLLYAAGAQRAGSSVTVQAYDSPEVRRGRDADGRSDQFSLAVIAYELLSGENRVDMRGVEGIPTVAPLEIDAFTPVRPGLGLHVNHALRTALGAGAANRFPTVSAFVDALEGRVTTVNGERTVRYRFTSFRPRVTAMLLVLLGGVVIAAAYLDPGANRVARRGWRLASGFLHKPVAAPVGPGVRVLVLTNDGGALPSAPNPKSGRGSPAASATSVGPPPLTVRSAGPGDRRPTREIASELTGGTSAQPTVTKQIAAGRRLASGSLDRAIAPQPPRRRTSRMWLGTCCRALCASITGCWPTTIAGSSRPSGAATARPSSAT